MLCILSVNRDIFFNLATEEFLLKHVSDDVIMIWRSMPSVVVGKHQNTFAEINYDYVRENNISVARRLSGGGAVFHDEGNLNFTFIRNGEVGKLVNFKNFIKPVIKFLDTLSITATIGTKNEILIGELKISGNAEHVHKLRVLHHGTLLYNSDIDKLGYALNSGVDRYIDKAVKSNRAKVTNISNFMETDLSINAFEESLFQFLVKKYEGAIAYNLGNKEKEAIEKLRIEKYATWDWVYGYSPSFSIERKINIKGVECFFKLFVVKGIIKETEYMNLKNNLLFDAYLKRLKGVRFGYNEIVKNLKSSDLDDDTIKVFPKILF
jgi:lipoate-protein ligase A